MIWRINIPNTVINKQLFASNALMYIRRYISSHQYLFTKTRNKLGISGVHKNYTPENVQLNGIVGNYLEINLKIKGIERAFRAVSIVPKRSKYLTIPTIAKAVDKSPREFNNLFKPRNRNVLAKNENGQLVVYYSLAKQVYQPMDKRLLPSSQQVINYSKNK